MLSIRAHYLINTEAWTDPVAEWPLDTGLAYPAAKAMDAALMGRRTVCDSPLFCMGSLTFGVPIGMRMGRLYRKGKEKKMRHGCVVTTPRIASPLRSSLADSVPFGEHSRRELVGWGAPYGSVVRPWRAADPTAPSASILFFPLL